MPLERGIKQFYFASGIVTDTEAVASPFTEPQILENARFDKIGGIRKKDGCSAFPTTIDRTLTPTAPSDAGLFLKIQNYNETPIAFSYSGAVATNPRLQPLMLKWDAVRQNWQYSSEQGVQGLQSPHLDADSWLFTEGFTSKSQDRFHWFDCEYYNGNVYYVQSNGVSSSFVFGCVNFQSRNVIFSRTFTSAYYPRIIKRGSVLNIFYYDNVNSIWCYEFNPTTSVLSGAQLVVNIVGAGGYYDVDVDVTNNNAQLAYKTNGGFPTVNIFSSLISGSLGTVLTPVSTYSSGTAMGTVITTWRVTTNMTTSSFLAFSNAADTAVVVERLTSALVFGYAHTMVTGKQRIVAVAGGSFSASVATNETGLFCSYIESVAANKIRTEIRNYSSTAAAGTSQIIYNVEVFSKVLGSDPNTIALRGGRRGQSSIYLYTGSFDTRGYVFAGKLLYGKTFNTSVERGILLSESIYNNVTKIARVFDGTTNGIFGVPTILASAGYIREPTFGYNVESYVVGWSFCELKNSFNSGMFRQSTKVGDGVVLTGASPLYLDGDVISELGHVEYPDSSRFTLATAGAGNLSVGLYSYLAVYEWTDSNGKVHLSAPSVPFNITTTAGNQRVTITHDLNVIGNKATAIRIYRTAVTGSIYTFVDYMVFSTGNTWTMTDNSSDSNIAANEIVYTASGELSNIGLGACVHVSSWKNRVIGVFESGVIKYTKKIEGVEPPEFADELEIAGLDSVGGAPIATAALGDKLLIFKKERIYYTYGDGSNDTGTFGDFAVPELLTDVYGCISPASIVTCESYVYFHSKDSLCRIGQNLVVEPIGRKLDYNFSTVSKIKDAKVVASKREIRFSDGTKTFVWNYEIEQWSIFNIGSINSEVINGTYYFINSSNLLATELTNGDTREFGVAKQMIVATGWLNFENIAGFSRVYSVTLVCRKRGNHNLTVFFMYDNVPVLVDPHNINETTANSYIYSDGQNYDSASLAGGFDLTNKPMIYKIKTSRQKISSLKIVLADSEVSSSTGSLDILGIAVEYGFKKNIVKSWMGDSRNV